MQISKLLARVVHLLKKKNLCRYVSLRACFDRKFLREQKKKNTHFNFPKGILIFFLRRVRRSRLIALIYFKS